ncbi:MAG: hypothetical protein EPO55_17530 [Reyranella sp.]|uniref:hypothetical protein n=1 Tax=Reyranella sp. TaxID=1929291 RepID=UPI0012279EAA|nr:hypothetical protein [Reyranella sp.]TAJ37845.1 MAG: hypothetical protein EPO55_17530 [Reyranella sp.]
MSLSSTTNKVIYNGNGATSAWPFSFPVLEAGHLAVIFTDGAGLETVLSPSLYSVDGIGGATGGSVTYPLAGDPIATPIPTGTKLTLLRTVPYTQTTVLSNQGGYYPEVVERRFDQIYMALQQLEERVSRVSLYPLSDPATEQGNFALIQQLQPMNILSAQGDLLTRDASAHKRLARGAAGQFLGVNGTDLAWAVPSQPVAPQGRLTLVSGEPVMTANQTGQASVFYTPYVGANVPIHDGSAFVPTPFTERSNDLTQGSTGKAGPAPAGPYQVIDLFVWNDSGTLRLTRGPKHRKAGTFTITVATPAVVSWVDHGLHDGATWTPESTTGNLPTGAQVVVGGTYFVTRVDADTFKLSTSLADQVTGTFINTSGTQSGIHTGANYTAERGTGAGTCELERVDGIWVNKHDITNGPAVQRGTYVGTIYCNASSQVDFKKGSIAAGFGEAIIGVWNVYNRVNVTGSVINSGGWSYAGGTRPAAGLATSRVTVVAGLKEVGISGSFGVAVYSAGAGSNVNMGVGFNSSSTFQALVTGSPGAHGYGSPTGTGSGQPYGLSYLCALEQFVSGAGYSTGANGGITYSWSY